MFGYCQSYFNYSKKIKKDNILNVAKTHYVNGDELILCMLFLREREMNM